MPRKNRPTVSSESTFPQTDGEAHFLAQALDFYRASQRAGKDAPFGQFLNYADAAVKEKGQELLRATLENIVQTEIDEVEKKMRRDLVRSAKRKGDISAITPKSSTPPADSSNSNDFMKDVIHADCQNMSSMQFLD
jgi:hypothetical protein